MRAPGEAGAAALEVRDHLLARQALHCCQDTLVGGPLELRMQCTSFLASAALCMRTCRVVKWACSTGMRPQSVDIETGFVDMQRGG